MFARRAIQVYLATVFLLVAWFGMQATHELGHIIHALISGGTVRKVELPLTGFSRTVADPNPHRLLVVIGGPVWGVMLPCATWRIAKRLRARREYLWRAFAGFCLLANGAYLGLGWIEGVGDAGDLLALGAPWWALMTMGLAGVVWGLWVLHGLGRLGDFGILGDRADAAAAIALTALVLLWTVPAIVFFAR